MSLDPEFLAAYYKADYVVFGDPEIVLHVGEKNARLDYLLEWLGRGTAAYVTAFNPHSRVRRETENLAAMERLKKELQVESGITLMEGEARDPSGPWPPEPSFLVVGIRRAQAEALGRRLEQNAIVFAEKGRAPELLVLS